MENLFIKCLINLLISVLLVQSQYQERVPQQWPNPIKETIYCHKVYEDSPNVRPFGRVPQNLVSDPVNKGQHPGSLEQASLNDAPPTRKNNQDPNYYLVPKKIENNLAATPFPRNDLLKDAPLTRINNQNANVYDNLAATPFPRNDLLKGAPLTSTNNQNANIYGVPKRIEDNVLRSERPIPNQPRSLEEDLMNDEPLTKMSNQDANNYLLPKRLEDDVLRRSASPNLEECVNKEKAVVKANPHRRNFDDSNQVSDVKSNDEETSVGLRQQYPQSHYPVLSCYACSNISNPSCNVPVHGVTTIKLCDSHCVKKVVYTNGVAVLIRDCDVQCESQFVVNDLQRCNVCSTELCNGAFTIDSGRTLFNSICSVIVLFAVKLM